MSSRIYNLLICDVTSSMLGKRIVAREVKKQLPAITILESEYNEYDDKYVLVTYNSESKQVNIQGYSKRPQQLVDRSLSFNSYMLASNKTSYSYIISWLAELDPTLLEKPVTEPNPETESYNVF